jgi:hypothetical protein
LLTYIDTRDALEDSIKSTQLPLIPHDAEPQNTAARVVVPGVQESPTMRITVKPPVEAKATTNSNQDF